MIAKTIRTCFPIAAAAVSDKAEEINKLNVFPVPDGDTGTNMSLTLASVTKELSALPADADMEAIAGAITHGSLMGARGNSGVITSQILRGVAEGLVSADEPITSVNIAFAFRRAVKVAFQAVRKPIEGTILTVLRDVSTKADECEKKKFSAEDALDAIVVEAYQSVARTPDLLPVLKENGVVDSGAFGFAIFLENFVAAALGRSTVVEDFSATFDSAGSARDAALGRVEIEANDDWEGSEFRYCNEFLFKADAPFDEDECLKFLGSMGDCELLVGATPTTRFTCTPTPPTWCSSTCCSLVRSTRSLSTTWRWRPTTVPPRFMRTRRRLPSPLRRWALSPLLLVRARPTSSSPSALT